MKRCKRLLALALVLLLMPAQVIISQAGGTLSADNDTAHGHEAGLVAEEVHAPLFREGHMADEEFSPMLFSLNAWETDLRDAVLNALESEELIIDVSSMGIYSADKDAAVSVIRDVLNENTRYFYMTGYLMIWSYPSTGKITRFDMGVMEKYATEDEEGNPDLFAPNWELIRQDAAAYENGVTQVLNHVKSGMTDVEKLLAMHDVIVRECEYDYDNYLADTIPDESYSAYGVFALDVAVCQGYAEAFADLCARVGIPVEIVSSSAMNHAWNMIQIDGKWYHMDATWDDPTGTVEGYVTHNYFLYSDSEFQSDKGHYGWQATAPQATDSGAFSGYAFRNTVADMHYYAGRWYYMPRYGSNLVSSEIDGSNYEVEYTDASVFEVHGEGEVLYLAKNSGIFTMLLPNLNEVSSYYLCVNEQDYASPTLEEITIRNNALYCVLEDSSAVSHVKRIALLQPAESHTHVTQYVEGVSATCSENGAKAYYKCHCDKFFEDVNATKEITNIDTWKIIAPLEHSPNEDDGDCTTAIRCSVCGEVTAEAATAHTGGAATCEEQAKCAVCGKAYGDMPDHSWNVDVATEYTDKHCTVCGHVAEAQLPHQHVGELVKGSESTCEEFGAKDYYECKCGDCFEDSECTLPITDVDTWKVVAKKSHTPGADDGDCTTAILCSVCGTVITEGKAAHTGGTATCEEQAKCSICGKAYGDTLPHSWNVEEATYKTDKHCTVCGHVGEAMRVVVFADLDRQKDWSYDFAEYVVKNGIMSGTSVKADGSVVFAPKETLTRGQFVRVLYNMEGAPEVPYVECFPDVPDGKWYTPAVIWAAENELVEGYTNGNFGVNDYITREQLAIILYKYAAMKGYDTTGRADISKFSDYEMTHSWALDYVQWANYHGIINGKGAKLDPRGLATRAECATMIKNFRIKFGEQ